MKIMSLLLLVLVTGLFSIGPTAYAAQEKKTCYCETKEQSTKSDAKKSDYTKDELEAKALEQKRMRVKNIILNRL